MQTTVARYEQDLEAMRSNPFCGLSKEAIGDALLPLLVASMRETIVQPLVENANDSVQQMFKQHGDGVARDLMPKIAAAGQVANTIHAFLRGDIARVPP